MSVPDNHKWSVPRAIRICSFHVFAMMERAQMLFTSAVISFNHRDGSDASLIQNLLLFIHHRQTIMPSSMSSANMRAVRNHL